MAASAAFFTPICNIGEIMKQEEIDGYKLYYAVMRVMLLVMTLLLGAVLIVFI